MSKLDAHENIHVGKVGRRFMKSSSTLYLDEEVYYVDQQPDSGQNNIGFTGQSYVDFTLQREIPKLSRVSYLANIFNSNAGAITLLPGHLLIDHYSIYLGNKLAEDIYGIHAFIDTITIDNDDCKIQYVGAVGGFDGTTFGTTNVIPGGATAQVLIRLPCLIDTARPVYAAWPLNCPIRIRIYFVTNNSFYVSGGTSGVSIPTHSLRIYGSVMHNADVEAEQRALIMNKNISYRVLLHKISTLTPAPFTANQDQFIQMTGLNGDIAWFHFIIRPINATGLQVINPIKINYFQVQSSTRTNLLGIDNIEEWYDRNVIAPEVMTRCFAYQKLPIYIVPWASDPKAVWRTGSRLGGSNRLDGTAYLKVNVPVNITPQIDIMAACYSILTVMPSGDVQLTTGLNAPGSL
jgi:hypothetical protein